MAVAASANTTGHWSAHHAHLNAGRSCSRAAMCSATVGPAMTRNIDARMNTAMPTVRATAVRRVFHQGRDSVTSYAALRVVMIDTIAPELLQTATKNANVRMPPLFCLESDTIESVRIFTTSLGAICEIIVTRLSIGPCRGKKLATAMTKSSAGNSAKKK